MEADYKQALLFACLGRRATSKFALRLGIFVFLLSFFPASPPSLHHLVLLQQLHSHTALLQLPRCKVTELCPPRFQCFCISPTLQKPTIQPAPEAQSTLELCRSPRRHIRASVTPPCMRSWPMNASHAGTAAIWSKCTQLCLAANV